MSAFKKSRHLSHESRGLSQAGMEIHLRMEAKPDEGQVKRITFRSKERPRQRGRIHELADQMMKEGNP